MIGDALGGTQRAADSWSRASISQFLFRLRDPRFWVIQALVIGISGFQMAAEATNALAQAPGLYLLSISAYFVPVVYAGLNFGLEGAVPTALWCFLLVIPDVIIFERGYGRLCALLQLGMMVVVAAAISYWIERETVARRRAEISGARLAQLNATATATSGSLRLEEVLSETVAAILGKGRFAAAWITCAGEGWGRRQVVAMVKEGPSRIDLPPAWKEATCRALAEARRTGDADIPPPWGSSELVVPVVAAGEVVGALGVAAGEAPFSAGDRALLMAIASQLGVALDNIRNYGEAALTLAQLAETQEALERYVQMAAAAQQEERQRLARELHDDTLQSLVIAKTSLESAAHERDLPEKARVRLAAIQATMEAAIDNVRRFSRDLRPSLLDHLGLVDAIEWLVNDTAARTGVDVRLATMGRPGRIERRAELAVYRIVQEALRNVERHAAARHCHVRLSFRTASLSVFVLDDGHGFDVARTVSSRETGGLGLQGMHERARLAHGTLTITSRPGQWTLVSLRLSGSDRSLAAEAAEAMRPAAQPQLR